MPDTAVTPTTTATVVERPSRKNEDAAKQRRADDHRNEPRAAAEGEGEARPQTGPALCIAVR